MTCAYLQDKKLLKKLYWEKNWKMADIAELFDVTPSGVHCAMERHGIKRRPRGEAKKLSSPKSTPSAGGTVRWMKVPKGHIYDYRLFPN